jgi:uncharacterized membrane protein
MKSKRLFTILGVMLSLLFIPLIAMQFTDEVKWTAFDFLVMGALLVIVGLIMELILSKFPLFKHRLLYGIILLAAFLLIWVELAVGIFGTPFAGQ